MPLIAMNDYADDTERLRAYPIALSGLGITQSECAKILNDPLRSSKDWTSAGCLCATPDLNIPGSVSPQAGPPSQFQKDYLDPLAQTTVAVIQALRKPPRPKNVTVIQKEPDYTTYAVIAGAVVVASVLAIAVGKSGRRS